MDLAALDLNLLVALRALLSESHVTRAAAALGTSQPAMSRSLARLRELFDDPLLVRMAGGMRPTPRAEALRGPLEALLAGVQALVEPTRFDPAHATGTITLALPDILTVMLLPPLLARLAREAPGLRLHVVAWDYRFDQQLERGEVDLTVGRAHDEPGLYARLLVENDWACVVRRGHPALRRRWTPERFADLDHLLVTLSGRGGGQVDSRLRELGLSRRIAVRQPYAALSPLMVVETDLVLTTARWLALRLDPGGRLVVRRPPFAMEPVRLELIWHERTHRDPKQRWAREVLLEAAGSLEPRELRWGKR